MIDDPFYQTMTGLGPFEARPHIAVALSGGGDSMALCLLANDWATARGGRVTALTVDHGLRPESGAEAEQVACWMADFGIDHAILRWEGEKPKTGLQAAARKARYRLLEDWCEQNNVLHLLLAHTEDDQAETVCMRLQRKSGAMGLAGMSAIVDRPFGRLLRPLLGVRGESLRQFLADKGQGWVEDPSNQNPAYERVKIRQDWAGLAAQGLTPEGLAAMAVEMSAVRQALEDNVARLLATSSRLYREGYAGLDGTMLAGRPDEIAARALARVIHMVGGGVYGPNRDKCLTVLMMLREGRSTTLGGCQLVPAKGLWLVVREQPRRDISCSVEAGSRILWDRRFDISLQGGKGGQARLAPLGEAGWAEIVGVRPELRRKKLPNQVTYTLPALFDEEGVFQVPHLDYNSSGRMTGPQAGLFVEKLRFIPQNALTSAGFALAQGG